MENMENKLFFWSLLSYGLMNIMVYGSIFQGLRDFVRDVGNTPIQSPQFKIGFIFLKIYYILVNIIRIIFQFVDGVLTCPMCFSFHGGWFLSLIIFSPVHTLFGIPLYISWFFDGIYSSGIVWAINSVIEWFEETKSK